MKASAAIRTVGALTVALALALAASFDPGQLVTRFPAGLDEISGIGQSRSSPNVFWVHNDSGDQPRVYAVNRNGVLLGTYLLEGASAVDWEDMAIGPMPGGRSYLYLADIGDNSARRMSIRVYRVLEPHVEANQAPVSETLSGVAAFDFVYEDGPRDAEGFMVDPLTGDFYIVSKREAAGNRLVPFGRACSRASQHAHARRNLSVYRSHRRRYLARRAPGADPPVLQRDESLHATCVGRIVLEPSERVYCTG